MLLRHRQEQQPPQPPALSQSPGSLTCPEEHGGQPAEAEGAHPARLLAGKGTQTFGGLEHPHCTRSFQEDSLA